ncbi:MAG: response regulator transcription factor [Lachnospiraceae bacterium]|nr:response regulator transcription factor [Lachnospiraceae bacterium]
MNMLEVLLVDDEPLLLESLEIILTMNQINVTGMAHDGKEALSMLRGRHCQLALVDLNMKGMGGIELIQRIKEEFPGIRILVLTTFYDDKSITDAITAGADGYLLKGSGKDAILSAINGIMGGQNVIEPKVMERMAALLKKKKDITETGMDLLSELTVREKEICILVSQGLNNKQIAGRLYISEGTVKNYMSSIYDKTGIHDRSKLIVAIKE